MLRSGFRGEGVALGRLPASTNKLSMKTKERGLSVKGRSGKETHETKPIHPIVSKTRNAELQTIEFVAPRGVRSREPGACDTGCGVVGWE